MSALDAQDSASARTPLDAPEFTAKKVGPPQKKGARFARLALLGLVLLVALLARPARRHVDAARLFGRFADPNATVPGLVESEVSVPTPRGEVRAKLFSKGDVAGKPAVVLVHGVQYRSIDEPRLLRFARAVADTGIVVLAPEVRELADYHVDKKSIDTIGAATVHLAGLTGHHRVGIMGMSFGGGLSLLTAADPRFRDGVGFVVAVGAHDDLGRILSFFATDTIVLPDGSSRAQKAHGYGATVLVYNRVEDFFPKEDVPEARLALRAWLQEKRDDARKHGQNLSPEGKKKLEKVLDADASVLRPDLQDVLARHREEDLGVSPHGHLAGLHAPVYLLHGEGDSVIPASETRWLAADVPPGLLRDAVVSPAIEHVEVHGEPTLAQKWELVHFMGQVIGEAENLP